MKKNTKNVTVLSLLLGGLLIITAIAAAVVPSVDARKESSLTLSLVSLRAETGRDILINGSLVGSFAIPNATIHLQIALPNGSTAFPIQGSNMRTDSNGAFSMGFVPTLAGAHQITASFEGDNNHKGTTANLTFNAIDSIRNASTMWLSLSASSIEIGETIYVNGSLNGTAEISGADVSLLVVLPDGTAASPTQGPSITTNSEGAFSVDYVPSRVGSYEIIASFSGNAHYNPSSFKARFDATPPPKCPYPWLSKIDIVSSPPSMVVGRAYTFQVSMMVQNFDSQCNPTPWYYATNTSITWTFSSSSGSLSYQSMIGSDGVASMNFTPSQVGSYHIVAQWLGNDMYQASSNGLDISCSEASKCPKPWPAKIEWVNKTDNMSINQTYTFAAQMSVQNYDDNCNPTQWYYAPNTSVTWTFTNSDGTTKTYETTTAGDGTCSVDFFCPSAGTWHVKAHWAGSDGYVAVGANWDFLAS